MPAKKTPKKLAKPAPKSVSKNLAPIRSALPVLSAARRAALSSLYTEPQCEAWGAKTKSADVHADGSRYALQIVQCLGKRPAAVDGYSLERASWLVECLDTLAGVIAEQKGDHHAAANAVALRENAETVAAKTSRKLRRKLRTVAGGNRNRQSAIADAAATQAHDAAETLDGLADLAERWLAEKNALLGELAREARLGASDISSARGAAAALQAAREGKTLGGMDTDRDTPPVNRAEGRVLREMRWAMDCFNEAHADDSTIPKLVPSAATRSVLATRGAEEDVAQPPPLPPPQTDGVQRALPKP